MRAVGPHVASKFCEIVKLRNKLARNLGYEDFYDYKVLLAAFALRHVPQALSMHKQCCILCRNALHMF